MTDTFTVTVPFTLPAGVVGVTTKSWPGHEVVKVDFANGYAGSVAKGRMTYGRYEVAVIGPDGDLDYTTPITDDVIPGLTAEEVPAWLVAIAALPEA